MDAIKTGEFLRTLRKAKGMTQEEVAGELFLSPKTVSRWESGANIPDINIIQAVAEFYGVTVDEILSGEKKTYDEETLSYKTKKEKREGRNRLIKESMLNKFNRFFYIALSVFAVSFIADVIFTIASMTTAYIVSFFLGVVASVAVLFFGVGEANRIPTSADEADLDEGVAEARRAVRRRTILATDIIALSLIILKTINLIASAIKVALVFNYLAQYNWSIIGSALTSACLAIMYVIVRRHFAREALVNDVKDLKNRIERVTAIAVAYAAVFSVSFNALGDGALYSFPVWIFSVIFGEVTPLFIAGIALLAVALILVLIFLKSRKVGVAIAAEVTGIASLVAGAIYAFRTITDAIVYGSSEITSSFSSAFGSEMTTLISSTFSNTLQLVNLSFGGILVWLVAIAGVVAIIVLNKKMPSPSAEESDAK